MTIDVEKMICREHDPPNGLCPICIMYHSYLAYRKAADMPTLAGPPLRKVTLNLYEADCVVLEIAYGRGWTTHVRDVVSDHAARYHKYQPRKTLGDFSDDD